MLGFQILVVSTADAQVSSLVGSDLILGVLFRSSIHSGCSGQQPWRRPDFWCFNLANSGWVRPDFGCFDLQSTVDALVSSLGVDLIFGVSILSTAEAQISSLGSDLEQVSINDLLPIAENNISLTNISVDSNINSCPEPMDTGVCVCLCALSVCVVYVCVCVCMCTCVCVCVCVKVYVCVLICVLMWMDRCAWEIKGVHKLVCIVPLGDPVPPPSHPLQVFLNLIPSSMMLSWDKLSTSSMMLSWDKLAVMCTFLIIRPPLSPPTPSQPSIPFQESY